MAKKNQAYWLDRQRELDKALEQDEQALSQRLLNYYENESQRLSKEIAHYYSEYGENNVLEYRNMVEQLSDADKKLLYSDLNEFIKKYPDYAEYMPVSTSIYQLDRLEGLQASIQLQSAKVAVYEQETASKHFEQHAKQYINNTAKAMGYGSSFYTENPDIVKKVVGTKWNNGNDFSALIWDNRTKLSRTLQSDVASAIARGDSYDRISKALQDKFNRVSINNIKRLVYTEDTFIREQANKEVFQQDFTSYIFHALPGACPEHCAPLDGKKFTFEQSSPGTNYPPMHPWCRCYITPDLPRTPEEIDRWIDEYAHKHGDSSTAFSRGVLQSFYLGETYDGLQGLATFTEYNNNNKILAGSNNLKGYRAGVPNWTHNCQRSCWSYELRKRGYNVTARFNPGRSDNFNQPLIKDPVNGRTRVNKHSFWYVIRDMKAVSVQGEGKTATLIYNRTELDRTGKAIFRKPDVETRMSEFGDGSRAMVAVRATNQYGDDFGHVLIAEQRNGKTLFLDPQSGGTISNQFFDNVYSGTMTRIDNIEEDNINIELLKKAVQNVE